MGDKNIFKGKAENSPLYIGDNTHHHHYNNKKIPKELTTALPRINPQELIGRTTALEQLHQQLSNNQQVVVVNGMGGLGKTALAQAYIYQYFEDYQHLAWISCNPEQEDLPTDLVSAKGLIQSLEVATQDLPIEDVFFQLLHSMKSLEQAPCLLVLDNATPALAQYFDSLPQPPNWHLLATSRSEIDNFTTHELGFLSTTEAIALFRKYYQWAALEDSFLQQLVEELEHHTLTIEILAKMAQKFRYSKEKLQAALPSNLPAQVTTKHSGSQQKIAKITDYLCSIFEWQLQDLTPLHKKLLLNFSCLPADYHAFEVLAELLVGEEGFEPEELSAGLVELDGSGWLLRQGEGYRMHRIVREVVEKLLSFNQEDVKYLIDILGSKIKTDDSREKESYIWLDYLHTLSEKLCYKITFNSSAFYNNLAITFNYLGFFNLAEYIYRNLCSFYKDLFPHSHSLLARSFSGLANILAELGEFNEARELLEMAIELDEKFLGHNHKNTAIKYNNLAMILLEIGELENAELFMVKAININELIFDENDIYLSNDYSNYSLILEKIGKYSEAKFYIKKAISLREKYLGEWHPSTAISYSNLASIIQHSGNYKKAKKIYLKISKSNEKNFHKGHPQIARNYSNLALVYQKLGQLKEAKKLLTEAIAINEECYGDHHYTAITYDNLAMVLLGMREYDNAEILSKKAAMINEKVYGMNNINVVSNYNNLSIIFYESSKIKKAHAYAKKANDIIERYSLCKHPKYQLVVENFQTVKFMHDMYIKHPLIFRVIKFIENIF